jgi:hypothetical protein
MLHQPTLCCCYLLSPAGESASTAKVSPMKGPVRVHTHTSICAHSPRSMHTLQTQIVSPLHAGSDGHARLDCNYSSFCGELDARLQALDNTIGNVRKHLKSRLVPGCQESLDRRSLLNQGLSTQMALSTAVFSKYCQGPSACLMCQCSKCSQMKAP